MKYFMETLRELAKIVKECVLVLQLPRLKIHVKGSLSLIFVYLIVSQAIDKIV